MLGSREGFKGFIYSDDIFKTPLWYNAGPYDLSLWRDWLADLPGLSDIAIPQCFKPPHFEPDVFELHNFCDASNSAYAAVCYLRMVDFAGAVHCVFVMAKSRLSPLRVISIPRLKLSAALLSVQVSHIVQTEIRLPISKVVFWLHQE